MVRRAFVSSLRCNIWGFSVDLNRIFSRQIVISFAGVVLQLIPYVFNARNLCGLCDERKLACVNSGVLVHLAVCTFSFRRKDYVQFYTRIYVDRDRGIF